MVPDTNIRIERSLPVGFELIRNAELVTIPHESANTQALAPASYSERFVTGGASKSNLYADADVFTAARFTFM